MEMKNPQDCFGGPLKTNRINNNDRDEWLIARSRFIGASESPILYDQGYAGQTRLSLFHKKKLGLDGEVEDFEPDAKLKRKYKLGHAIEPVAINLLDEWIDEQIALDADDPDREVCVSVNSKTLSANALTLYVDEENEMSATPDGLVLFWQQNGGVYKGVVEAKNVDSYFSSEWSEGPPLRYEIQVQHQMSVTRSEFGLLIGIIGGQDYAVHYIERNEDFIRHLKKTCREFMEDVRSGKEPDATGAEIDRKILSRLHPDDNGETVSVDDRTVRNLARAKKIRKEVEDEIAKLENKLRQDIGDATFATCDGYELSLKTQERKASVRHIKASKYRTLRLKSKK